MKILLAALAACLQVAPRSTYFLDKRGFVFYPSTGYVSVERTIKALLHSEHKKFIGVFLNFDGLVGDHDSFGILGIGVAIYGIQYGDEKIFNGGIVLRSGIGLARWNTNLRLSRKLKLK